MARLGTLGVEALHQRHQLLGADALDIIRRAVGAYLQEPGYILVDPTAQVPELIERTRIYS